MLVRALKTFFGYETFKPGQREIIEAVLDGQDVLAILPTGRGKSICYQLPALLFDGLSIVVSPLLSLMEDQVQQLRKNGLKQVVALNSFTDKAARSLILSQLSQLKLLYTSPEMLQSPFVLRALKAVDVSMFVIDEAHCVSHWGHDFRPDYLRLHQVRSHVGDPRCLAITATAPPRVQQDVVDQLKLKDAQFFVESVNRENVYLQIEMVGSAGEKVARLEQFVSRYPSPGVIYVQSRNQAMQFSHHLQEKYPEKSIAAYHGGMEQTDRLLVQQQFMHDQLDVICATNAFGMGLNKADVRYVVHMHYPLDIAAYVQEIGRAGRDGKPAIALLVVAPTDRDQAVQLLQKSQATRSELEWLLSPLMPGEAFATEKLEERGNQLGYDRVRTIVYLLEHWGVVKAGKVNDTFAVSTMATKIEAYFNARDQERLLRLQSMVNYVSDRRTCRRNQLLCYFHEQSKEQAPCCDVCGLQSVSIIAARERKTNREQSWQAQLARLFVV